ncbi:MAG: SNF2-related protein [Alcanivoracaceae bacterium]
MLPEGLADELQLSASIIRRHFSPAVFQRGRDYFASGKVMDLQVMDEGEGFVVQARVKGSGRKPYEVGVWLSRYDSEKIATLCSCPYEYDCKHGVAMLLALDEQLRNVTRTESPAKVDPALTNWLASLSKCLHPAPTKPSAERLCYELAPSVSEGGRGSVRLTVRHQKQAAKGGWSKGRVVPADDVLNDYRLTDCLDGTDRLILALLSSCMPPLWEATKTPILRTPALAPLLTEMVRSGRCYWEPNGQLLLEGERRALGFSWRREGGSFHCVLELEGVPFTGRGSVHLIQSATPCYVDPSAGVVGEVDTPLPTAALSLLRRMPVVPESQAVLVGERLAQLLSPDVLPPPIRLETVPLPFCEPTPVLHLFRDQVLGILARLRMDYSGHVLPLSLEQQKASWVADGKRYEMPRDLTRESSAVERLRQIDLHALLCGDDQCFTFLDSSAPDQAMRWLQLEASFFPELKRDGWRISRDKNLEVTLLEADDWQAEINEGGQDWFDFSLGIQVGEERLDLRTLLAALIKQVPSPQALEKRKDPVILPLADGRYLHLPTAMLGELLKTLFALFDQPEQAGSGRLNRVQALAVAAMSGARLQLHDKELKHLARALASPLAPRSPAAGFQAELRPYQRDGLAWMWRLRELGIGGVLADDMGLGKTVQVLALLHAEKRGRRLDQPVLIIAPTSLLGNWQREAARFAPTLSTLVWHGSDRDQSDDPFANADLIITTYGLLVRSCEILAARSWHYVVLDEAQQIKNPRSKAAQAAMQLESRHRLCLTGTPMENHLGELWSLFNFAIPGYLGDESRFREHYRKPIEQDGDGERAALLARRVSPFLLRRTKDEVAADLPGKVEITRTIPLTPRQADLYENVRLAMDKRVRQALAGKGLARSHITVLDALLKLRQICCDPQLLPTSRGGRQAPSAKREYFIELVRELVDEGRRILVFSQFTSMLALLEEDLQRERIAFLKLTGQTRKRQQVIDDFRAGSAPVFLISLKAGGVGLNLIEADTVIHYDPWWNPAVENQATDRAHRIGQDKTVFVYRLVTENTVEEKILALQQRKEQLADSVYREGAASAGALGEADIAALLAPVSTGV